jgi:hypothetical protein
MATSVPLLTPQVLRFPRAVLESGWLVCVYTLPWYARGYHILISYCTPLIPGGRVLLMITASRLFLPPAACGHQDAAPALFSSTPFLCPPRLGIANFEAENRALRGARGGQAVPGAAWAWFRGPGLQSPGHRAGSSARVPFFVW